MLIHAALNAGLTLSDLDEIEVGTVLDILTENANDNYKYQEVATQDDFDSF